MRFTSASAPSTTTTTTTTTAAVPAISVAAGLFAAGMIAGWFEYLDRSPVREKMVPGTSAWWQHLGVAIAVCAALGVGQWRHRRRFGRQSGRPWLLAPLAKQAMRRLRLTAAGATSGSGIGRALLALPLTLTFLYCFFRAGLQVTNGLDPNATVNAWGGPTYAGAMACHYLDCLAILAATAWLLNLTLQPDPATGAGELRTEPPHPQVRPPAGQ